MLVESPYFLKNKEWYIENKKNMFLRWKKNERQYFLTDKAPDKAIKSYIEYYKLLESDIDIIEDKDL